MKITTIVVPTDCYNPICFFMEALDFQDVTGVKLTSAAYERMKEDPKLIQKSEPEYGLETWITERDDGSSLKYILARQTDGGALLFRIVLPNRKNYQYYYCNIDVVVDYQKN